MHFYRLLLQAAHVRWQTGSQLETIRARPALRVTATLLDRGRPTWAFDMWFSAPTPWVLLRCDDYLRGRLVSRSVTVRTAYLNGDHGPEVAVAVRTTIHRWRDRKGGTVYSRSPLVTEEVTMTRRLLAVGRELADAELWPEPPAGLPTIHTAFGNTRPDIPDWLAKELIHDGDTGPRTLPWRVAGFVLVLGAIGALVAVAIRQCVRRRSTHAAVGRSSD